LFHFAHLVAFAVENDETIWYPYISEFSALFENLKPGALRERKILIFSSLTCKLILKISSWGLRKTKNPKYICFSDDDREINLSQFKKTGRRILFLSGWLLRDKESLIKQRDFIKKIFQFDAKVIDECNTKLLLAKKNSARLVGVHIRRGDYQKFQDGKFFYDAEVYSKIINQLTVLFASTSEETSFVICTNDPEISKSECLKHENIYHSEGNQISDLCMLSKCDYIIGPPSTFSAWASFYGDVPLTYLESKNQTIKLSDFKIITG
jgi:hypothetical protein